MPAAKLYPFKAESKTKKPEPSLEVEVNINGHLTKVFTTPDIIQASRVVKKIINRTNERYGLIYGEKGTGKTIATHYLSHQYQAIRICCYEGITLKDLLVDITTALGNTSPNNKSIGRLVRWLTDSGAVQNRIFLIDEANYLNHKSLNMLRYLSDEAGAGIILFGTELLPQKFKDANNTRSKQLEQFLDRIGGGKLHFQPLPEPKGQKKTLREAQIVSFFLKPRFGTGIEKNTKLVHEFYRLTQGYWRRANKIGEACQELMERRGITELNEDILQAAYMYCYGQ